MPKTSSGFGRRSGGRRAFGRGGGTVTIIEDRVQRSYTRTAKITFYVVATVVGLLVAVVLAGTTYHGQDIHPIVALIIGGVVGGLVALPIAAVIAAWPIIRAIWWWTPEIGIATGLLAGWVTLANHTTLPVRLITIVLTVGVPAGIPAIRRRIMTVAWCFIARHRLRVCFNEFIISNLSGSLPFILWARPTRVGERVWIWLRPGLSKPDLDARLDKMAVACWATAVTVEEASTSNSAFVRVDIKRRDALTGTVTSPLIDLVDHDTPSGEADAPAHPSTVPNALDLPDVDADTVTPATRDGRKKAAAHQPATPTTAATSDDDVSDWI